MGTKFNRDTTKASRYSPQVLSRINTLRLAEKDQANCGNDSTGNSDESKQVNHLPESVKLGLKSRDTDNLSPPTSQESNRSRQPKNKSSRCSSFSNKGTIDSPSDSAGFGKKVIYSQVSPKMAEIIRDFDRELDRFVEYKSPLTRKETLSLPSFGNKGTIDSPSDSDEFGKEMIYSHESPEADEIIRDFDWDLDRFVAYRSPLTTKEILSLGSNSSHWNINNPSVIDNQRNEIKTSRDRTRVGTEIVIDVKNESYVKKMRVLKHMKKKII
jgi:hypothetical protein